MRCVALFRVLSCALFLVGLAPGGPSARAGSPIVLNEVLYDPDGTDGGAEFVELAAAVGADPGASLAGWVLETGNGARPGEWQVEWTGGAGDRLRNGLFLIGESGVEPRPEAIADLDLQNGPDACRLRGPAGEADVLGWGEPLPPEMCEGRPAADVCGLSLARLPDGFDCGENDRDFLAVEASPGAHNAPELCLVAESVLLPPPELLRSRTASPTRGRISNSTWASFWLSRLSSPSAGKSRFTRPRSSRAS
jgi:hypothetical protein